MNKHRVESQTRIAALFAARAASLGIGSQVDPPLDSATIHRLAVGESHRAERECNEDLGCRACDGSGLVRAQQRSDDTTACPKCLGTGSQLGPKSQRAAERAREIAKRYGMRLYEQGDPRGCPYYLIPQERIPFGEWSPNTPAWIASNYSSVGVAVHP